MAPSRTRRARSINNGDQDLAGTRANTQMNGSNGQSDHPNPSPPNPASDINNTQLVPTADDNLSRVFTDMYTLLNIHAHEVQQRVARLRMRLQYLEAEVHRRLVFGQGSSRSVPTRVPPGFLMCRNCMTFPATIVYYPCRHLCVCVECDTEISPCPICNRVKQFSFMVNQPSA
ncbi:putative transcription factor C2H2 family [Helianthus anomalus]